MTEETRLTPVRKSPLAMLVDARQAIQGARVRGVVRLKHLEKLGKTCPDTEEVVRQTHGTELWIDGRLKHLVADHPTAWWWSHIKGAGFVNISLCIGAIEQFGRYYPEGDPAIPPEVRRAIEDYLTFDQNGDVVEGRGVWVEGIERLITPSKQRVYIGHAPHMKRQRGQKLPYNSDAKMVFWRLGGCLVRASAIWYLFYVEYKEYLKRRSLADGISVVPTPKGRYCPECDKEFVKKAARYCPDCGGPLATKTEPPGVLYLGHLDLMARRRMQQLFSDQLNIVWRQALGLPTRDPYPVEKQGHSRIIWPEDMLDKACGKKNCPICERYELK